MENLPPLHPGHIYIKKKVTGQILIIADYLFDERFHEKYDSTKIETPPPVKKPTVEEKQKDLESEKEKLATLSVKELKNLPEFEKVEKKIFRNKEEAIQAIFEVRNKEEKEEDS